MAKIEHYYTKFEEGKFYHIYNRTINKKLMFKSEQNYIFFLKKFNIYLADVLDIYAYCLLNNHFHFLIRINDNLDKYRTKNKIPSDVEVHDMVSKQFRVFFQSYALAFNKQHTRVGTLFQTPFKRALVDDENYISQLIYYINSNPQKHKLTRDFRTWKWSSYQNVIFDDQKKLKKTQIINWFDNENDFIAFHDTGKHGLNSDFKIED